MSKRKKERKKEKLRRHKPKRSPVVENHAVSASLLPSSLPDNPLLEDASDLWKRLYAGISQRSGFN